MKKPTKIVHLEEYIIDLKENYREYKNHKRLIKDMTNAANWINENMLDVNSSYEFEYPDYWGMPKNLREQLGFDEFGYIREEIDGYLDLREEYRESVVAKNKNKHICKVCEKIFTFKNDSKDINKKNICKSCMDNLTPEQEDRLIRCDKKPVDKKILKQIFNEDPIKYKVILSQFIDWILKDPRSIDIILEQYASRIEKEDGIHYKNELMGIQNIPERFFDIFFETKGKK